MAPYVRKRQDTLSSTIRKLLKVRVIRGQVSVVCVVVALGFFIVREHGETLKVQLLLLMLPLLQWNSHHTMRDTR